MTALTREMTAHLRDSARNATFATWALATALLGWAGSTWIDTLTGAL